MRTISLVVVAGLAFSVAAGTKTWDNSVANTPDTAYLWGESGNWLDSDDAPDIGDSVVIAPSSVVYIDASAGANMTVLTTTGNNNARIIGDLFFQQSSTGTRPEYGGPEYVFGDVIFSDANTMNPYINGTLRLCGRMINRGTKNSTTRVLMSTGTLLFYLDKFATSANATRTGDVDGWFGIGNGTWWIYAPTGAVATAGTWRLTEGSPYAYRVSASPHALVAGTTVTSSGYVKSGTFLKHVFDDATIELSAPAESSGDATLSFAAFTPNVTMSFPNAFRFQGAGAAIRPVKGRAEDTLRVDFSTIECGYTDSIISLGCPEARYIPGTIVMHNLTGSISGGRFDLQHCNIELAGTGGSEMTIPKKFPFTFAHSDLTARLEVPAGIAATIAKISGIRGKIVKDGGGSLNLGISGDTGIGYGAFSVEAGTLAISRGEDFDGDLAFKSLSLADGTTLVVPAEGIRVASLSTSGNVTISGGKVFVENGNNALSSVNFGGVTFANGGDLGISMDGDLDEGAIVMDPRVTGEVVGHPAFWVDASKPESLVYTTENGTNFVTRWNDCRDGEPMFCTNITQRPTFIDGTSMTNKYVRLMSYPAATDYRNTDQLVWSVPIYGIKAVFLVQDPTEGGGQILGRCSWRLGNNWYGSSWGGPFYRDRSTDYTKPLVVNSSDTMGPVRYGRFYLNGHSVVGRSTGYLGPYMQLLEFHANTNYYVTAGDVACDAFGGCHYNEAGNQVKLHNGGMRIAEYIIYTNSLTYAERAKVAQYLCRKWLDRNVYCAVAAGDNTPDLTGVMSAGAEIDVRTGKTVATKSVTSGTLVKTGEGTLYVNGLDGADLSVEGGRVLLAANTSRRYVPNDTWIHVDAANPDSLVTKKSGDDTVLDRWYDVNGGGESYKEVRGKAAKIVENALNGLPMVDLGPVNDSAKSSTLRYYDSAGKAVPGYDQLPANMQAPLIKTAFVIYDSTSGGGSIFSGIGSGYPGKGLPHQHSNGDDSPIVNEPSFGWNGYHGIPSLVNAINNGTAVFRRNGVQICPTNTPFLRGPERLTFAYNSGRKADHLCGYGQSLSYYGGLKYGEVALYDRRLTDDELNAAEAYFAKKWFDIDTPGYGSAANAVSVAAGSTLEIVGDDFSATSLSGGGTIDGDAALVSGGTLVVPVASGAMPTLSVTGSLSIDGGTIALTGDTEHLPVGTFTLLSADAIENGGGAWTVSGASRRVAEVAVSGTALTLTIRAPGLCITVE